LKVDKRKILQSAQKHLQKGALDKALKDYQTLLEADPRDVNLRLKVGDLQLRMGRNDDAVAAYLKVADRFMKDGFDAKAVALYKQITRIDAKRVDVYLPLAELYQRLGLTSDAMSALQTAADAHYREGNKPAALELLRKMASLDPSNTTSRLKVAELLRQEGMKEEALAEFDAVAEELERQGEVEGRASVLAKMVELDPSHLSALERLGRCMIALRKWSQASEIGRKLADHGSESNVEGYEILAEACQGLGREDELPEIYKALAQALRDRGEEDRAREIAQRFTTGTVAASATDAVLLGGEDREAVDAAFGATGSFGAESFEDSGFVTDAGLRAPPRADREGLDGRMRATAATPFAPPPLTPPADDAPTPAPAVPTPAPAAVAPASSPAPAAPASASAPSPAAPFDAEQLLAEASVYLRYGKHERAIESLRGLLAREPGHRRALERLAEACAATGQLESAVEAWERAAALARDAGDADGFEAIRARLEAIDPMAAGALGEPPAGEDDTDTTDASGAAEADDGEIELSLDRELPASGDDDGLEIEIDELDVGDVDGPLAGSADALALELDAGASGAGAASGDDAELSFGEVEIATSPPAPVEARAPEADEAGDATLVGPASEREEPLAPGDVEFEIDFDASEGDAAGAPGAQGADRSDAAPLAASDGEDAADTYVEASSPGGTSGAAAEIASELETAAFFLAQGMLDEAEEICRRVLEVAPSHPQALLRLGEIEAARGAAVEEGEPTDATEDDTTGQLVTASPPAAPQPAAAPPRPAPAQARAPSPAPPVRAAEPPPPAPPVRAAEPPPPAPAQGRAPSPAPPARAVEPPRPAAPAAPPPAAAASSAPPPAPAAPVAEHADGSVTLDLGLDEEETPAPAAAAPAGDFDLAAELSDALDGATSAAGEGTEEEGFRQVFAAFKAGVEKQLGAEDYEARYDLGIAYREMGLFEDAIGEFRIALEGPNHKLQCLHMLGLCALDLGRARDAVAHLEQALAWPDLPVEQQTALRFDLGRAHEALGDRARARAAWEAVAAADPSFADVGERLAALDAPPGARHEPSDDEGFESFDDLMEEDAVASAEARPEQGERYESFDDLVEADPGEGADETAVAEITATETADDTSADEPDDPPRRAGPDAPRRGKPGGGRRKKISFV